MEKICMENWKEIIKRQVEGVLANKNHIYIQVSKSIHIMELKEIS